MLHCLTQYKYINLWKDMVNTFSYYIYEMVWEKIEHLSLA